MISHSLRFSFLHTSKVLPTSIHQSMLYNYTKSTNIISPVRFHSLILICLTWFSCEVFYFENVMKCIFDSSYNGRHLCTHFFVQFKSLQTMYIIYIIQINCLYSFEAPSSSPNFSLLGLPFCLNFWSLR